MNNKVFILLLFCLFFSFSGLYANSGIDQINNLIHNNNDFKRMSEIIGDNSSDISRLVTLVSRNAGGLNEIIDILDKNKSSVSQLASIYKKHAPELNSIGRKFVSDKNAVDDLTNMKSSGDMKYSKLIKFIVKNPALKDIKSFVKNNKTDVKIVKNIFSKKKPEIKRIREIISANKDDYKEIASIGFNHIDQIKEFANLMKNNKSTIDEIKRISKENKLSVSDYAKLAWKNPEFRPIAKILLFNADDVTNISLALANNKNKITNIINSVSNLGAQSITGSIPIVLQPPLPPPWEIKKQKQSGISKILAKIKGFFSKLKNVFKKNKPNAVENSISSPPFNSSGIESVTSSGQSSFDSKSMSKNSNLIRALENQLNQALSTGDMKKVREISNEIKTLKSRTK